MAEKAARAYLRVLWFGVIPALLAVLAVRWLVPTQGAAKGTWAAPIAAAGEHQLVFSIALFVLFHLLARYWRHSLSGGSDAARVAATAASLATTGQTWLSRYRLRRWLLLLVPATAAVTLLVVIRAAWVTTYVVADTSMLPSLEPSDVIVETKHPYGWRFGSEKTKHQEGPRRGDVIVFEKPAPIAMVIQRPQGAPPPETPARVAEVLAQRVVGLPGDRITMRGGIAFINDWQVPVCPAAMYTYPLPDGTMVRGQLAVEFLDDRAYLMLYDAGATTWPRAYDVKEGEVFVLGDNRSNNSDSRSFNRGMGGGVPYGSIEGRADKWLFGRSRDERIDLGRGLAPIDLWLRLDGIDSMAIKQGIERCLALRPQETHPPGPNQRDRAAGGGHGVGASRGSGG